MKKSPFHPSRAIYALAATLFVFVLIWAGCKNQPHTHDEDLVTTAPAIAADAWKVPIDAPPGASLTDWMDFAWNSFIAVNWPAQSGGANGQPDTSMNIIDPQAWTNPVVWFSYLEPEQTFLPDAVDPGSWNSPTATVPTIDTLGVTYPVLGGLDMNFAGEGQITGEFDQADSDLPLIDQQGNYVYYEMRINQAEFAYLSQNQYYNAQNQIDDVTNNTFASFPDSGNPGDFSPPITLPEWAQQGSVELKASWRILVDSVDIPGRYFTLDAFLEQPDGSRIGPVTLGLVGMHILRLTPSTHSTWFWATFEQVDNLSVPSGIVRPNGQPLKPSFNPGGVVYGDTGYAYKPNKILEGQPLVPQDPVGVNRAYAIPSNVASANTAWQAKLANTPWQYYQLVNTVQPDPTGPTSCEVAFADTTVNTCAAVNSTMETYTQTQGSGANILSMNCMDCHAYGFPQGPTHNNPDFQVFTFLLGHAVKSPSN